jgi:Heparinase II/III-like protein/Heparinase II/III N-terminus
MTIAWYVNRLRRMSAREVAWRLRDETVKRRWRWRKGKPARPRLLGEPSFAFAPLDPAALQLDPAAGRAVIAAAERVLAGRIPLFEREAKLPLAAADWFIDPDTGREAPAQAYTFDVDARDAEVVGNLAFTPARMTHVTLLAAAYFFSGREEFAALAAAQLRSWWEANPFLTGVHWSAGIELALRLVVFAWTRRLLAGWSGVADLFERSAPARDQIYRHQQYLSTLRSHGSSANNHLIAELLGLYVGASAFPWFAESARWRALGRDGLEAEARRQIFPDGVGRELATEYHGFTMEMLMLAAVEADLTGDAFSPAFRDTIARMADAWAAQLDVTKRPPRQGDSDDAYALLIDPSGRARRALGLLAEAKALVGAAPWWPETPRDLGAAVFTAIAARRPRPPVAKRPSRRPNLFADAGIALLRDLDGRPDEIWCRCDHGPHGYLAIAAHAHADALSVEVRHGGVDLLIDPGTYCYLGDPAMRRYVRSTIAHNTLEIGGQDQALYGGSFLWLDQPRAYAGAVSGLDDGPIARWRARHEGYRKQPGQPIHERAVTLDRTARRLHIEDKIVGNGPFPVRLAYHLGPAIETRREGDTLNLKWQAGGQPFIGRLVLSPELEWREYRRALDPPLGWYSPAFYERVPSISMIGSGRIAGGIPLRTRLSIEPA